MTGFDAPVVIYPAEFRAAEKVDVGDGERNSQLCHTPAFAPQTQAVPMPETCVHREFSFSLKQSGMDPGRASPRRDDRIGGVANDQPP